MSSYFPPPSPLPLSAPPSRAAAPSPFSAPVFPAVRGVLWGGLLLGLVESHAQALLGAQGREFATYALLFMVLVSPAWRPYLMREARA